MSRFAYVNGRYLRLAEAAVSIEDRAFQFGDGVYEVCQVRGGALIDESRHLARLERSLKAVRIAAPVGEPALRRILREVVTRNRVRDGLVYLQISRGAAKRDHGFPAASLAPGLVVTAKSIDPALGETNAGRGVKVVTVPDERWAHPHVKTLQLLPNVLAKQAAREAGATEAWFVDPDGFVTEGASTNAWIVDADGTIRTRDTNANILRGITRKSLIDLAAEAGFKVTQRPFTVEDVKHAKEAFMTAASALVLPVVAIDGATIGDGKPGPVGMKLRALYEQNARATAL